MATRHHNHLANLAWHCDEYGHAYTYTDGEAVVDMTTHSPAAHEPCQHSPRHRASVRLVLYLRRVGFDWRADDTDAVGECDGITVVIPGGADALTSIETVQTMQRVVA